jgi:hypothetical protein
MTKDRLLQRKAVLLVGEVVHRAYNDEGRRGNGLHGEL